MNSSHLHVSRMEMLIARQDIFRGNYCHMHFAKYFPDRLAFHFFFFFFPVWEHIRGISQSEVTWHFNNGALLVSRTKRSLPSSMLQSNSLTIGLVLLYENYHNLYRDRESYSSVSRKMSNDKTGGLVFKRPIEHF